MLSMGIVKVTASNFKKEVLESKKPVLIDFWASWCGPCKMLSPVVDAIADEQEEVKICKVNIDEELELAQNFRVMNIPTLLVVKEGKVVDSSVGFKPKEQILSMLELK